MTKTERQDWIDYLEELHISVHFWYDEKNRLRAEGNEAGAARCLAQQFDAMREQNRVMREAFAAGLGRRTIERASKKDLILL